MPLTTQRLAFQLSIHVFHGFSRSLDQPSWILWLKFLSTVKNGCSGGMKKYNAATLETVKDISVLRRGKFSLLLYATRVSEIFFWRLLKDGKTHCYIKTLTLLLTM